MTSHTADATSVPRRGEAPTLTDPSDMVQLLTPEGERVDHPDFGFTGDAEQIRGFLREMVLMRRLDNEATSLQRQGELGLWPPSLGQEGAQIGVATALNDLDMVFPTYREHGVGLHQGLDPIGPLSLFRGTSMGDWDINANRFGPYALIIGTQGLHAVGYAMGLQFDGMVGNPDPSRNAATLAFHGDGASSQGDINEAYVFAASYSAPVVFFCQNNQWAISEPIERQSKIPLYQRARGFGFPGVRVDGNDVLAVHAVSQWALQRARSGQGPAFIEAYTYRMGAHTTADDPSKYRLAAETEHWRYRDPIERVTTHLGRIGELDGQWWDALQAEADAFGAELRERVRALKPPPAASMFDHVYAEPTPWLDEQRAGFEAWLEGFGPDTDGEDQ